MCWIVFNDTSLMHGSVRLQMKGNHVNGVDYHNLNLNISIYSGKFFHAFPLTENEVLS